MSDRVEEMKLDKAWKEGRDEERVRVAEAIEKRLHSKTCYCQMCMAWRRLSEELGLVEPDDASCGCILCERVQQHSKEEKEKRGVRRGC
jgi:hypothetical protein